MRAVGRNPKPVPPPYNSNANSESIEKGTTSSDNVHTEHAGWGDTVSET
jgi:hypothetical protein